MSTIDSFAAQLSDIHTLVPRDVKGKKVAQAIYTRQVVTIVGVKTTAGRFLPVSHAGYSNETYVDKLDLLDKTRAEFIGRKLKGIERRAHMAMFREMVEADADQKEVAGEEQMTIPEMADDQQGDWRAFFAMHFGTKPEDGCTIPDKLCLACWNCSLFGGLVAGKGGTFSRIRYFDTFSVEDGAECIQTDDSPEQMAIGNTVGEDLSVERGEASFHRYEYVKAGTRFPFLTIIESPTLLDVAGYLSAIRLADQHGYGKYSANHGKFKTQFFAVSTGYPMFSVLDMLQWLEKDEPEKSESMLKFEAAVGEPVSLFGDEIIKVQKKLDDAFTAYVGALKAEGKKPKKDKKSK